MGDHLSLDPTDYRLLQEITANGRISDVALGERVHLSSTAAARRRKDRGEGGEEPYRSTVM